MEEYVQLFILVERIVRAERGGRYEGKAYMTQCRILGKFEYTGGPIFKVVLEC